jgi:glucokinase
MYVYFDIGGTKTRVSISHDHTHFEEPIKFSTPRDMGELLRAIKDSARTLGGDAKILAGGGGIACPVDRAHGTLFPAPNLPQEWFSQNLVQELSAHLEAPVYISNDTEIIALGEAVHGAAKGYETVVYITVSTGVGGARIVGGRIESQGISAEPGRQIIDFDRSACPSCMHNTAEGYTSGTATEHRFHVKPYEVQDPAVWEELALWCAYMLNNTIVHWTPDVVVLGGSMIVGDPAIPTDRISAHLAEILTFPRMPDIKKAELQDIGGVYGAMEFVRQKTSDTTSSQKVPNIA